ncbi:hypothetical protein LCGC14_0372660 [marine sediment metagenome]|uniref:Uncharacterized protein n=1 Tax=marine sediment metagenome TaxID=412755 RepID=A0A0F9T4Y8_9ZZZZ
MFPWTWFTPELVEEEDEVVNLINVIQYDGSIFKNISNTPQSFQSIKIEDTETLNKAKHGSILPNTSRSLHQIDNGSTAFQTTNAAKVILIIEGNSTDQLSAFDIIEDASADAGTGTVKQAVTGVNMVDNEFFTSKILSFAASKFITIKVPVSVRSSGVFAFIIE